MPYLFTMSEQGKQGYCPKSGDRVRVVEIHCDDPTPNHVIGETITLAWDPSPVTDDGRFWVISDGVTGITYARVELVEAAAAPEPSPAPPQTERAPLIELLEINGAVVPEPVAAPSPLAGGNPKDVIGANKAPLSTLEPQVVHEMALGMFEGECKYWRHNYIASRVRAMVYSDAHDRHMSAWKGGQDIDPDSGLPHLVKAMACLHIIRAAEIHGSLIDDRPPANPNPDWMRELDAKALEITRRLAQFERGAFTEANRAEWPAMCERLANGPIRKVTP